VSHQLLLADDSLTIQRVIRLTFADEDVNVMTVSDGNQAVAAIDNSPPDIVLVDISMPGRSGYDVAQHMRDTPRLAHIPVVLLTAASDKVDEARASAVGCDRVLSKPFDPQVVISCVRELLARPKKITPPVISPEAVQLVETDPAPAVDIDAYFDRLDLTFANAADSPGSDAAGQPESFAIEIAEGLDPLVTPIESPGGAATGVQPLSYAFDPPAFGVPYETGAHASTASEPEEGSLAAGPYTLFPVVESSTPPPVMSDELIDEIATRVLDRLMARLSAGTVPDVVTAVAERLVRAEIDGIKNRLQ
jgi:CheY-like chemotaxis protein